MSKRHVLVIASLLIAEIFSSRQTKAQTGLVDPRKTEYICVLSRTVKGSDVILVLPCEAANVRQDRLIAADFAVLEKMQAQRILLDILNTRPKSEAEARSTRMDFLKFAKEVCERHPQIALLPLDWKTEQAQRSEITQAGGMALKPCGTL